MNDEQQAMTQFNECTLTNRGRVHNYYQGPYPNPNNRLRSNMDFQQRGRNMNNRRGNYRPRHQFNQRTTNMNASTGSSFQRSSMLEDPWLNMTPVKVPSHGTSLIPDESNN